MDGDLVLVARVAEAGAVIGTEPCFEVTGGGIIFLSTHDLADALPDPDEAA
jgi:hypothetical protein